MCAGGGGWRVIMIVGLALPKRVYLESDEVAVTFVVPAPNGCNMACAFCAIRARAEAKPADTVVQVDDYLAFLRSAARRYQIGVVSLQGYEPLLPESWFYTRAVLEAANDLGLSTALVTNGSYLSDQAQALKELDLGSLSVSIDSASAEAHDHSRGTPGAFELTMQGLKTALAVGLGEKITVASVIQKGKSSLLNGMPALLASVGLTRWVVTPVQSFGRVGGTVDTAESILREAKRLYIGALEAGITFELDDELEAILCTSSEDRRAVEQLHGRRVQRADQIIRLSPSGAVSRGAELRRRISETACFWDPRAEGADDLLRRLDGDKPAPKLYMVKG